MFYNNFWGSLGKVYVDIRFLWNSNSFALEIVDGYLKFGQSLAVVNSNIINNEVIHVKVKIVSDSITNQFVEIPNLAFSDNLKSILITVYFKGELIRFQWIDFKVNILGEPKIFNSFS
jgi:hypothetical protein